MTDMMLQIEIRTLLKELGFKSSFTGVRYLIELIAGAIRSPINSDLQVRYFVIAKAMIDQFINPLSGDKASSRVERSVRHAIQSAWAKYPERFRALYIEERPTNKEFIAAAADEILVRIQLQEMDKEKEEV